MKLQIQKIDAIGKRMCPAHLNTGENTHFWGEIPVDVFPPCPDGKAFQTHRRELELTLADAAKRLGLAISQVSGLERGEYVCDWELAVEMLEYEEMVQ